MSGIMTLLRKELIVSEKQFQFLKILYNPLIMPTLGMKNIRWQERIGNTATFPKCIWAFVSGNAKII